MSEGPIVLYDGVCGLCDRTVQFILARDRADVFRFAPLQGEFAAEILGRHGKDPSRLETVYVVLGLGTPSERLLSRARAILYILRTLGGPWAWTRPIGLLPDFVLNLGYNLVARVRYRIFGKHDSCRLPDPGQRHKFLEVAPKAG